MFPALLAFCSLPAVLLGYAGSYWALVGVAFLLGVAGSSFAVGIPFVAGWYRKERQGLALGIYGMGNIGTAVDASVLASLAARPRMAGIVGAAGGLGGFFPPLLMGVVKDTTGTYTWGSWACSSPPACAWPPPPGS